MVNNYYALRGVGRPDLRQATVPAYMLPLLPDRDQPVLDFGCGLGELLHALRAAGWNHVAGADVDAAAVAHLRSNAFEAHDLGASADEFFAAHATRYALVVMSHVLEHIPKSEMVDTLRRVRALLRPDGRLLVMAPNAQSNTGAYWAYEDFTHHTLFTAGSLAHVLGMAGFDDIELIDPDCTAGLGWPKKATKRLLLALYKANRHFWNKVTSSAYHRPSPSVYSYEIKLLAKPR